MNDRNKACWGALLLLPWSVEAKPLGLIAELEWELHAVKDRHSELQTDHRLATLILGIEAELSDVSSLVVTGLYEEDATDPELDVAVWRTTVPGDGQLLVGQDYLPFALFETALIQDPLGFAVGETRARGVLFETGGDGLRALFYVAQSETTNEMLAGGSLVWEDTGAALRIDLISDVLQSRTWLHHRHETDDWSDVPAVAVAATGVFASTTINLGYLHSHALPGGDALETAQLELRWPMDALELAVSWQYSADDAWLVQPRQRVAIGGRYVFSPQAALAVELWWDEAQATTDSVTGVVAQLALRW